MSISSKLIRAAAFALLIAFSGALLSSCGGGNGPEPTEAPSQTEPAGVEYSMTNMVRYWPEDADYDTCDYACVAEVPAFSQTYTYGYAMNNAVLDYMNGLMERIVRDYMPASVAKPPYTEVGCTVEYVGKVTNVIFKEKHCYEAQPYTETYVLMLSEQGEEISLCDIFLNYHTEQLIAEKLAERIAGDPMYYEADSITVLTCIDIEHGAKATEDGCVLYVHEGLLASYDEGELEFSFPLSEVLPDFVGEGKAMSAVEYRSMIELLAFTADGCVVRMEDIEDGRPSEYAATSFMGELTQTLGIPSEAGRISVPKERFLSLFKACFGTDFPGINTDAHNIIEEEDAYSVRASKKQYRYNVDILSAERSGDRLTLTGDIVFGDFGYAFTQYVCHVDVVLAANSESPYGFTLESFRMHM